MTKHTPLSEIGEVGLIELIKERFAGMVGGNLIAGAGDDAAVLKTGGDKVMVVTMDLMIEGIHFDLVYTPLKWLGYKLANINFSDIYAMNCFPSYFMVGMALTGKYSVEMVEEFYEGVELACKKHNVQLIGGDTVSGIRGSAFCGVAIGECNEGDVVYRSGAQPDDILLVTGELGSAYAGILVLEQEKIAHVRNPSYKPDLTPYEEVIKKALAPEARRDIISFLREKGIKPSAMMDISDGLSSDLMKMCRASHKGAKIFEDKIPVNRIATAVCNRFNMDIMNAALHGGEDYELLIAMRPSQYEKLKESGKFYPVGFITEEKNVVLVNNIGQEIKLRALGWDAFKDSTIWEPIKRRKEINEGGQSMGN